MAKTDFKSIDEYQSVFPEAVRERMQQIRTIVKEVAPEAVEGISYQIPAFKIGKHFLIYYSGYAKHISLSSPWSVVLLEKFAQDLAKLKVTKSAIQLPLAEDLPIGLVREIVEFRKHEIDKM